MKAAVLNGGPVGGLSDQVGVPLTDLLRGAGWQVRPFFLGELEAGNAPGASRAGCGPRGVRA